MTPPADQTDQPSLQVTDVRVEHREPFGIGVARPRLSWRSETSAAGWRQATYEIEVVDEAGTATSTGALASSESVLVDWPAEPLTARARRTVRVRVTGDDGSASAWSDPLELEAGLLDADDWTATFASPDVGEEATAPAPPRVHRARRCGPRPALRHRARRLRGRAERPARRRPRAGARAGRSYGHRLRYETFDVTARAARATTPSAPASAEGWYRGRLGFGGGARRDLRRPARRCSPNSR